MTVVNELLTEEQLELDRVVREGLCTRPASGPYAQSIDEAAQEILARAVARRDVRERVTMLIVRLDGEERRKAGAALAVLAEDEPDPWARLRRAAAMLRGEEP